MNRLLGFLGELLWALGQLVRGFLAWFWPRRPHVRFRLSERRHQADPGPRPASPPSPPPPPASCAHSMVFSSDGHYCYYCGKTEHDDLAAEIGARCRLCGSPPPGLYNWSSSPDAWKCNDRNRRRCMKRQIERSTT